MQPIRPLIHTDTAKLAALARESFWESFIDQNDPVIMKEYCETTFSNSQISREMQHPHSRFFGIEEHGQLVSYIKVNVKDAQTELCLENSLEVERIYVLQSHQGKGFGKALLDYAKCLAEKEGWGVLWLGVWEHNISSINFYKKYGLVEFSHHPFYLGTERQTDILMKMPIEHKETRQAS